MYILTAVHRNGFYHRLEYISLAIVSSLVVISLASFTNVVQLLLISLVAFTTLLATNEVVGNESECRETICHLGGYATKRALGYSIVCTICFVNSQARMPQSQPASRSLRLFFQGRRPGGAAATGRGPGGHSGCAAAAGAAAGVLRGRGKRQALDRPARSDTGVINGVSFHCWRLQLFLGQKTGRPGTCLFCFRRVRTMPLHYDSADNLYIMAWGRKRVTLAEPGQLRALYPWPR